MCMENINLQYKTIFTSFGQNTAGFCDKHILFSVLCIFWPDFGLKPRYFALHGKQKKKIKTWFPLRYETY